MSLAVVLVSADIKNAGPKQLFELDVLVSRCKNRLELPDSVLTHEDLALSKLVVGRIELKHIQETMAIFVLRVFL